MCGEHALRLRKHAHFMGSSPRVRGAQPRHRRRALRGGIIPACAGSTRSSNRQQGSRRDHPRVCGEHHLRWRGLRLGLGSSPRVRGARFLCHTCSFRRGIIPACAGSTCGIELYAVHDRDHPRVCGEHLVVPANQDPVLGSSPRVRGAPLGRLHARRRVGIIPACAGST